MSGPNQTKPNQMKWFGLVWFGLVWTQPLRSDHFTIALSLICSGGWSTISFGPE